MALSQAHASILWRQVWGLSAMLAAILIGLMIYGMHQSSILIELGFAQFASTLGFIQALMGAVIEPLIGYFSDQILQKLGSRLPQIAISVTLASLLFVILAILLPAQLPPTIRWLFPLLMSLWLAAMLTVRGPIVALLRQLAPTEELPIANSIFVLVLGLVGAIAPLLEVALNQLGNSLSFVVGAIILVMGAMALYRSFPAHSVKHLPLDAVISPSKNIINLLLIGLTGVGTALEINLLLAIFIPHLQQSVPQLSIAIISAIVLFIAAITANPLSFLVSRWGATIAMQISLSGLVLLMILTLFPLNNVQSYLVMAGFGVTFGTILISMVPFVLSLVAPQQAGLSTGVYFGSSHIGALIFLLLKPSLITGIEAVVWVAIVALIATLICLDRCHK